MKQIAFLLFIICVYAPDARAQKNSSGYIRFHTSSIFYTTTGTEKPLLLVHAGFLDHRMWRGQVAAFANKGFRVVTIDLPGHGQTRDGDSAHLVQEVIKTCLDSLGIQKTSLVGLSLGGSSVTDFALAYPERVDKLVLAASTTVGYDGKYPVDSVTLQYFPEIKVAMDKNDLPAAAAVFTRYWCVGLRKANEVGKRVRDYVYQTTLQSLKNHNGWQRWARFAKPYAIERLHTLSMPVLLIYGDRDLPIIPASVQVMKALIRGSRAIELKGVAHMLNMEVPGVFNQHVLQFLLEGSTSK